MLKRKPVLIGKAFRKYLWASILSVAAAQIANIVDAAIVGNMVGQGGLAAVNLSKPLIQAFFSLTCLYVASSTILAGMAKGKGDQAAADKLFTFSVATSLVLGLLFTTIGLSCFGSISGMLCQSDALRPLSDDFMRVTLCSAAPQMLMLTLQQFVTMDGEPGLVSRAVIVGNVVNLLLDIVFIRFCGWGISGAACATFVMYIVCILMVLPHFRKKDCTRLRATKYRDIPIGKVLSIGLPLFLSTVLISVQYIGNNYVAGTFLGDDGLVALAVCMQLFAFSMVILNGALRTIQPVGAILKGMDDSKGLLMLVMRGYRFMGICFAVFTALLVLFPAQIGSILGVPAGSGLDAVKAAVPVFSINIVLQGLLCNLLSVFQFYGRKGLALTLSISQALLPMVFFMLMRGNWAGFIAGQVVTGAVILIWGMILRRKDRSLCRIFLIPMNDDRKVLDMTVDATIQSLSEGIRDLRAFLCANGKDDHTVNTAAVCAEEFVCNIIRHGHASSIDIGATVEEGLVKISIHDDGLAFDPVTAVKSSETRIGLGLTIAQAFCEDISYRYIFNQNMVTFKIKQQQI